LFSENRIQIYWNPAFPISVLGILNMYGHSVAPEATASYKYQLIVLPISTAQLATLFQSFYSIFTQYARSSLFRCCLRLLDVHHFRGCMSNLIYG
jgi:hypothetical protein